MWLLLSQMPTREDIHVFLSGVPVLADFNYHCKYINVNVKYGKDEGLTVALKESLNMLQEFKLKNLEKKANIAKFMNYFSDFYALVEHFNNKEFYCEFLNLFEQLSNSIGDYNTTPELSRIYHIRDLKVHFSASSTHPSNLKYQKDVLSLIQNIYYC